MMSGGSSVYSPLPQSNSDSDEFSEEELHSSSERQRIINRISKLQKQATPELILNGQKKIKNYKQLDNDRDIGITLNGFQLGTDEIAVLKSNNKIEKFSTSRKICFAFSIFLCVFTTVVFLWILPCEIGSCPSTYPFVSSNGWKKVLFGIELYGPISIVPNARDRSHDLVFLFRNSLKGENETDTGSSEAGSVISLLGTNGRLSWWAKLEREPKDIDCNIIDVDLDGVSDCLVVGRNNLLKVIQSLSGNSLWNIHGNNDFDSKSCDLNFPIVLLDLDGDHVNDLLTICSANIKQREGLTPLTKNYFLLISGKTGKIIGKPREISHCHSIRNFMLEKENLTSYTCLDPPNEESVKTIPLRQILLSIESPVLEKVRLNQTYTQRVQHKNNDENNIFYVDGRRLSLENRGRCPENCNMLVTVKDERNDVKNQTLWVMKSSNAYGMIPIVMKFGKFSGFVFKYWQWESNKERDIANTSFGGNMKTKQRIRRLNNPKSLEYELFRGEHEETQRNKRMLAKRESGGRDQLQGSVYKEENFTFHKIIERVVLIIFNETDSHSVNASESEIIQICKNFGACQPDVSFQRHSLMIADLDHDNFQELVSYTSSFVSRMEQDSAVKRYQDIRWKLQSIVQVIRLEADLPKLYDSRNQ